MTDQPHSPYGPYDPYPQQPQQPQSRDRGTPHPPPGSGGGTAWPSPPGATRPGQPSPGHGEPHTTRSWNGATAQDGGRRQPGTGRPAAPGEAAAGLPSRGQAHAPGSLPAHGPGPLASHGPGPLPPEQPTGQADAFGAVPPHGHPGRQGVPAGPTVPYSGPGEGRPAPGHLRPEAASTRPGRARHADRGTDARPAPTGPVDRAPVGAARHSPAAVLTPAQRARAEGRSPIIEPGPRPALLTAGLAALIAATAPLPRPALAVAVALLQAVTAAGWFRLNGMWPARQGIVLAFLAGVTTDAVLLTAGGEHAPAVGIGTLGVWCLAVLILQLRHHGSPDERLHALTATVASTALTVLAAGQLAAEPEAVVVGAAAVGVTVLVRALPLPALLAAAAAVLAGVGAGAAAGAVTGVGSSGALLGVAASGCALIGLRVASYDYPSRFVHMTAGVALPLTVAAPAVYLIGRAIG